MTGGPYSLTSGFAPPEVLENAECAEAAGEGPFYFIREQYLGQITDVVVHGPIS
jgi:hypothetical protein